MGTIKSISQITRRVMFFLLVIIACCGGFAVDTYAETTKTEIAGKIYEFAKNSHYEFSESKEFASTAEKDTYGTFFIDGKIADTTTKNGVPSYHIEEGNLKFYYNYSDTILSNDDKDNWHLIEDKSKKLDDQKLDENILKGSIILQTSNDQKNWVDVVTMTNAFSEIPIRTESIYETKDVQLLNGCYYRVIVAYKLGIRVKESNLGFINTDQFEYKKCVEVYEFYAYTGNASNTTNDGQTYSLGNKVRVSDFDSYSGEQDIKKGDPHYGYDIGEFFVSGYTAEEVDSKGNTVFLKNAGDKVILWFRLNEDINKLNGNKDLAITEDKNGSDQYFETPTMNFGKGTLIIRYTNHNNEKSEPTIYTNYLEANTSVGAETKVQLFEEGDYEVALDYEITNNRIIDEIAHYRIFFKFSIRNGNCMVYPFDVVTGNELTNSSMTENGFRLDLAKSRYLKVNLMREILTESADGLIEDTRFNGPAQDGAEYTEEGIYTITVSNVYTGQFTVKKIYVGNDKLLKAYMTTGLPISEIKEMVEDGATISDDGIIQLSNNIETDNGNKENLNGENSTTVNQANEDINNKDNNKNIFIPIVIVVIVGAVITLVLVNKKKKDEQAKMNLMTDTEGEKE